MRRWIVLAALIFTFLFAMQFRHLGATEFGVDGSYYFQVARHVSEGRGLLTSVDLYHQGLKQLPSRTNIYPLWPLVLGGTGRVSDMLGAAKWLPRVIAAIDLVLLYLLTIRIARERELAATDWPFDVGHLAVSILATNAIFFASSTVPYTEALGFLTLFGALLMMGETVPRAAAAGLVGGLAFLTRSQCIVVAPCIVLALLLRRRFAAAAAASAGFAIAIAPWLLFLATFVQPFKLAALISMYRETPAIPAYDVAVQLHGTASYIADRARGLLVAFNPQSSMSFVASFGVVALLVPVAAVMAVLQKKWRFNARSLATLLTGVALSAMLVLIHNRFFLEWLFGYRHGLPFILLIMLALIELLGSEHRAVRYGTVAIAVISIVIGAIRVSRESIPPHPWPPSREAALSAWLERNDPNAIVMTTNAQTMSAISRANFRWTACDDDPGTSLLMLTLVRTDYVAAYDGEQRCSFLNGLVGRDVDVIATFGEFPERLFLMRVRRQTPTSSAPPSAPGG